MATKRDKILKTAEKLVQKGKLDQAIKEYEKLRSAAPDDTNTINRLGDLYGRVGEIDKAVELYGAVAEKFEDQGFVPKAIAMYKKINRLAPQRLDIFERLGELYVEQGLLVEAKGQFQMLAEHYAKNDDMESAFRVNQRLIDIAPNDASLRLKFADLLLESGSSEDAMAAYGALGASLIANNQLDEAERLYRRLLGREIPDGEIMAPICDRLLDAGRVTAAQELLAAGLAVSGDSIALRTLQVRAHMAMGNTDEAVALAREVLAEDPENADVRGIVGSALLSEGDDREAAEMMIPAAEALLEKAEYSKAQKMLRELVKVSPTDERILRLAIRAFRPSGDQEMLTRLTASLADVCFTSGQEDQAKRFYLELVASDPTNELYRQRLAILDGAGGGDVDDNMDTAGLSSELPSEISFALEIDEPATPEESPAASSEGTPGFDPAERISEAAVFARYGLSDKAIRHLESVLEQIPGHEAASEELAKLYLDTGERDKALNVIGPVIEARRRAGDDAGAADLEQRFGQPDEVAATVSEEEDDEVIIVEIDGDELGDVVLDEVVPDEDVVEAAVVNVEPTPESGAKEPSDKAAKRITRSASTTDAEELLARALSGAGASPDSRSAVPEAASQQEIEIEDVVIDADELVEIAAGVEGPPEGDLAQLDLFIDQELYEDAAAVLDRLEEDFPGDPELATRRNVLDAAAATVAETATAGRQPQVEPPAPEVEELFGDDEDVDYVDLAKELEEELAEEEAMVEEATGRGKGEALLDEVFKEFQKGVAEQLSDEDSDTHFNLGIAYKEMGLLEEAIGEFKVASHDPAFFVEACSMIGVCATELGRFEEAAEWYQKALVAPDLSADARTALRYELASALEQTGEVKQAEGLFQEIYSSDPAYRDVGDRLASLSQQRQVN